MKQETILTKLECMADYIGGKMDVSSKGTPHIIYTKANTTFSVCYFARINKWKIFFPFPSERQVRIVKSNMMDVKNFLESWQGGY